MNKLKKYWKHDSVILLILFMVGLLTLTAYGEFLDQHAEQDIMYSNVLTYCQSTHLFPKIEQTLLSQGIVPIEQSIEKDHGLAALYPMAWIWFVNAKSPFLANIFWHLYIYCFNFLGTICLYLLVKDLFSKKTAVITTVFYFFSPRFFAHMHYNDKDMILLTLVIMTFFLGFRLMTKPCVKYALLLGFVGGVLGNVRIIGVLIWGFMGVVILAEKMIEKEVNKRFIFWGIVCVISAVFAFLLLTPATWFGIKDYLVYVYENAKSYLFDDYVLFGGKFYSRLTTGTSRKYLPVMMLMTTPVGIVILCVLGIFGIIYLLIYRNVDYRKRYALYAGICCLIPLAYAVFVRATVYNGWRHFAFVYGSIMMFLAFGVDFLLAKVKKERSVILILALYISFLVTEVMIGHPYQYAYYNEVARFFVEDCFELDYWDMSFKQGLEYIAETDTSDMITIAACDNPSKWGLEPGLRSIRGKKRMHFSVEEDWTKADYVFVNRTYAKLYSSQAYQHLKDNYEVAKAIHAYGNELTVIYKRVD